MADSDLKDRLRDHAEAFDSLLSLIPAKMYYGQDAGEQWKKKKQTKEQAKAARRGKLDPDSELNRNAKEVMDERARNKRKLRQMQQEDDAVDAAGGGEQQNEGGDNEGNDDDTGGIEKERPGEGLKKKLPPVAATTGGDGWPVTAKKPRLEKDANTSGPGQVEVYDGIEAAPKSRKQAEREEKKLAKNAKKEEKKKPKPEKGKTASGKKKREGGEYAKGSGEPESATSSEPQHIEPSTEVDHHQEKQDSELIPMDVSGLVPPDQPNGKDDGDSAASRQATDESLVDSAVFDSSNKSADAPSTATSISSTVPPAEKPGHLKIPADTTALRARLAAKIEAFRAARKADGTNGRPIRTRQELIESRRREEAQRKARKKELRRQEKEAHMRKREEALTSSRNSPASVLSPVVNRSDDGEWDDEPDREGGRTNRDGKGFRNNRKSDDNSSSNHFSFGKIAFSDGTQMSHDLSYDKAVGGSRKKGPSDAKTALLKVQAGKRRMAGMAEDKRKEVLERETWLAARRRAEGERPRDDEALLKQAVRRKERAKKKSEREWVERAEGVAKAAHERQRKRDDNIRKRKEDKGGRKKGGKKSSSKSKSIMTKKKVNRPGFEGGFGGGGRRK